MLSRTADHLFWMARYMERAENTARMLDVNYQMSLLPQSAERGRARLARPAQHQRADRRLRQALRRGRRRRNVMDYMVRDAANGSSIRSCLMAARENARAVRGTLTTEVWETQNQTWLEFQRMVATDAFERDPSDALRVGQVPLAPVARRHRRHDAAGRGASTSCASAASSSAPTTRRACSTSSSTPSTASSSARLGHGCAATAASLQSQSQSQRRRRGAQASARPRAARTSSSTSITGRRCCARCPASRSTARSTAT